MRKSHSNFKAVRTFDGLRDTLFNQLDELVNGKIKPETANAVARVASEITKSVSVQVEVMRLAGVKAVSASPVPGIRMLEGGTDGL